MASETLKMKYIKDYDGNRILPVTHENAVFDSEGVSIGQKIENLKEQINNSSIKEIELDNTNDKPVITNMQPNCIYYKRASLTSLTIDSFAPDGNNLTATYTVLFMVEDSTSLILPYNVKWLNDEVPDISTFSNLSPCELSIRRIPNGDTVGYTAVLGRFANY